MKREFLKAIEGLTDEQINSIMAEHGKTVEAQKAKYEAKQTEMQAKYDEVSEKVAELEKSKGDQTKLNATIEELQGKLKANEEAQAKAKAEQEAETVRQGQYSELDTYKPENMEFSSTYAKEAIFNKAIQAHQADKSKTLKVHFEQLIKDDKGNYADDIFKSSVTPADMAGVGNTGGTEDTALAQMMSAAGITPPTDKK